MVIFFLPLFAVKLTSNQEDGDEQLVNAEAPDKHSLQVMAKKSLAVISHGDEDKLELDTMWIWRPLSDNNIGSHQKM
jgi:hypothetical protein